jgi:hypothetical protein
MIVFFLPFIDLFYKKYKMRVFLFLMIISVTMPTTSTAQVPPPLGPPLAGVADIPLQKIKFSTITQLIEKGINTTVTTTNLQINNATESSGLKATLSGQIMAVMPSYGETRFITRPNQRVVQLQIKLWYTLSAISYHNSPFASRKLVQEILITISCDKWNTDTGKSKISYIAEMPHIDEAVFGITPLDTLIRTNLAVSIYNNLCQALSNGANPGELPGASHSCNCLSFKMGTGPVFDDGYAGFYYLPVRKIAVESLYSNPIIRLLSIERLDTNGKAILIPQSDIQIQFLANYNSDIVKLRGFKENEKILHRKVYDPMEFEHPAKYNQLVVIANLTIMDDAKQTLSGFMQFDKTQKYGEGTQRLTIMGKEPNSIIVSPDDPPITPAFKWVPAYEIVFEIRYKNIHLTQ